jgi:flavin-dependent dehydrogenase
MSMAMVDCDVLIIGGGPAGSTCAGHLRRAGLDVVVVDRAAFPRDKVCGGWITPQVVASLALDLDEYRQERTLQAITGFRTGIIGGRRAIETAYGRVVSFGIRRCEFDHFLLRRCGARARTGVPVRSLVRRDSWWVVDDEIRAPMLIGAGWHYCPVAALINGGTDAAGPAPLVDAKEL